MALSAEDAGYIWLLRPEVRHLVARIHTKPQFWWSHTSLPHTFTESVVYTTAKVNSGAFQHKALAKLQQIQRDTAYNKDNNMVNI